jgi:hypothetical protein
MNRNRQWAGGVGMPAGAFAAALIGVANTPAARADNDPFEDLFGDSGINTWTPTAYLRLCMPNTPIWHPRG